MEQLLGTSVPVFLGLTVVLFGGAAWMTGRALALHWKSVWQGVPYGLLLALGARFLTYALFEGRLLSVSGYLLTTLVLFLVIGLAYRLHRVGHMIRQYPWLYERHGLLFWREKQTPVP